MGCWVKVEACRTSAGQILKDRRDSAPAYRWVCPKTRPSAFRVFILPTFAASPKTCTR